MFRVAAVVLPAAFLLTVLEVSLRLGGYGYPTGFLLEQEIAGQHVWVDNPRFAWRFMPPALARFPAPMQMPVDKPDHGLRILVFGESAAMGDPEPAFGFSRVLRALLEARYPGRPIEVVNTAFPAINSHVIRECASESRCAHADVWIVYLGNNEVLGPYGLTTAFGTSGPNSFAIRAGLWLRRWRVGQLLGDAALRLGPPLPATSREMHEALTREPIYFQDQRLSRVYRHFAGNLDAILREGQRAGARVVVNTLVSNLKDCGPFFPGEPNLTGAPGVEWQRLLRDGRQQLAAGAVEDALTTFTHAARIENRHAELQYQVGRGHLAAGRTHPARQSLETARDLDGFRARADSRLNDVIRQVAARYPAETFRLVDAEAEFALASPDGVPGDDLLCDHVHFRFAGNYLLAKLQAEAIAAWLPGATNADAWLAPEECGRRLGLTDWGRYRMTSALRRRLGGPLFRRQSNHAERDARLHQELLSLEPANRPEALPASLRSIEEAIARSPRDWVLQDQLAKIRLAAGDRAGAAAAWSNVVQSVPQGFMGHYQLGLLLNQPETVEDALEHLLPARDLRPLVPEVHVALGTAHTHRNQPAQADAAFQQALALDPDNESARLAWALSFARRNQWPAARQQLELAIAGNTNSLAAHFRLAQLLAEHGDRAAAGQHFREVLRLDPRNESARRFLSESEKEAR